MAQTRFTGPVASDNGFIASSDNGKTIALTAPGSLAASYALTLPPNDGTNGQFLSTDGSGVLSWTAGDGTGTVTSVGGTGTVSGLTLSGTVTTTGNLTLGGALNLSSPPAIGGTAPAAGAFTTVTATSATLTDFVKLTAVATSALPAAGAGNAGQVRLINDNGAGDNEYCLVISTGAAWVTAVGGALS